MSLNVRKEVMNGIITEWAVSQGYWFPEVSKHQNKRTRRSVYPLNDRFYLAFTRVWLHAYHRMLNSLWCKHGPGQHFTEPWVRPCLSGGLGLDSAFQMGLGLDSAFWVGLGVQMDGQCSSLNTVWASDCRPPDEDSACWHICVTPQNTDWGIKRSTCSYNLITSESTESWRSLKNVHI